MNASTSDVHAVKNMGFHGQMTISRHSQVANGRLELDIVASKLNGVDPDLLKLLTRAKPDELSLVGIQFESVRRHPFVNLVDADGDLGYKPVGMSGPVEDVELSRDTEGHNIMYL